MSRKSFNEGDSQGGMWEVWCEGQAAVKSADGKKVPWQYSGMKAQGHWGTTGQKEEDRHLDETRHDTKQIYYVISSVHMVKKQS